ncbi:histidine-rich glycoprotein-like [Mercenaria mercenaria]|uniref:histidine-rich glycoprotein-like n=1 Tax=Mercenaria mercenaria TaxID=6596 RepID=UPI00234FB3EB|nr:histidine-rich glycoprotein-like [Mercenaria mercenaria]
MMATPDDLVHCPVCLEVYEQPRALPCLHTFCSTCIQEYINAAARATSAITDHEKYPEYDEEEGYWPPPPEGAPPHWGPPPHGPHFRHCHPPPPHHGPPGHWHPPHHRPPGHGPPPHWPPPPHHRGRGCHRPGGRFHHPHGPRHRHHGPWRGGPP